MEMLNLILSGSFLSAGVAIKSILLLLVKPEDLLTDEFVKMQVDEYKKSTKDVLYPKESLDFITWVFNDKFDADTIKRKKNSSYFFLLNKVKHELLDLYTKELKDLAKDSELKIVGDFYTRLEKDIIKLMRLRQVIQPEIQISRNVHPVSNIPYLAAKAFWLEDTGERTRKFTKSLGREDEYDLGNKDPKVEETAITKIQEVMYLNFKEAYPE